MFLPGESQGRGSLVGCRLWGCTESDTTEVTRQQQQWQVAGGTPPTSLMDVLSHVQLSVAPWTIALQGPLLMEFSRQEYWSCLPFPIPGELLDLGIKLHLLHCQAAFLPLAPPGINLSGRYNNYICI